MSSASTAKAMAETISQGDQIKMPNNGGHEPLKKDSHQSENLQVSKNGSKTNKQISCETCGSAKDCEEDVDNPGEYYCKSCWEEYDCVTVGGSQQSKGLVEMAQQPPENANGQDAGGDVMALKLNHDPTNDGTGSTSPFMTPTGLSLGTQAASEASLTLTPASQALMQTQLRLSLASSQEQASKKASTIAAEKNYTKDIGAMDTDIVRDDVTREMEVSKVKNKSDPIEDVELLGHENNATHDTVAKSLVGAEKSFKGDESDDIQPDNANGDRLEKINQREGGGGDDTEKNMEIDEGFDDVEDDDASLRTQEIVESRENDGEMGGAFGLLTQGSKDDDSDTDDGDSVKMKEVDNVDGAERNNNKDVGVAENIIKNIERKDTQTNQAPMIEAVTTTTNAYDKNMALSGLTDPTQSQNILPRDKLPRFCTLNSSGVPSHKEETKSPGIAMASSSVQWEKPRDLGANVESKGISGNHSMDASSAYHGLSEEDEDEIKGCLMDNVVKEKSKEEHQLVDEKKANACAEGSCDKSHHEGKGSSDTPEDDDGKMEVAAAAAAAAAAVVAAVVVAAADELEPSENDAKDSVIKQPSEATLLENEGCNERCNEEAKESHDQLSKNTVEVRSERMTIDDAENKTKDSSTEQQDKETKYSASEQPGEAIPSETKDLNRKVNEDGAPQATSTAEVGTKQMTFDDAEKQQDSEAAPLKNDDCDEKEANEDNTSLGAESEGEHIEGTGDTFATTGSGSGGWSLYEGDTQMLPTGPSQVLDASSTNVNGTAAAAANAAAANAAAAADYSCPPNSAVNNVDHEQTNPKEGIADLKLSNRETENPAPESCPEDGEKVVDKKETTADDEANNDLLTGEHYIDDLYSKETQKINMPVDKEGISAQKEEGTKEPTDAGGINECIMEQRGQVDDDYNNVASMDNMKYTPENGSLPISYPNDYLDNRASPTMKASCERPPVDPPLGDKMDEDDGEATEPSQDLLAASPVKPSRHDFSEKPSHHAPQAALNEAIETEKSTPQLPPQKKSIDGTKWMSSARHSHGTQDDANSDCSPPRLLMPSFKPIHKNSDNDEPTKHTLNDDAADGTENDSWTAGHLNYNDSDSIENTQDEHDVERPSAFKRLSRGISRSSAHSDSSSSKFTPLRSNETKSESSAGIGTTRVIKPKVLRYETVTKHDDASVSSRASDSSSEAEFSDGDTNDVFQQSQSDIRIMKQLKEVKAITSMLPTAEEMNDIASRKQLTEELEELEKSHKTEINKLKRENSKLGTQLKIAEETIKQKNETIKQKNEIIKQKKALSHQQSAALTELMEKYHGLTNMKTSPHTKHTPPATTSKKRKKINGKPFNSDSDSDDDDEVPLSALKNARAPSTNKKRRKSYGSRQAKVPAKKAQAKKTEIGSSPKAASVSNRSGDTSSADTSRISNQSGVEKHKNQSILFPVLWKKLQEKGWKYQTGPKPYNKVYVPRDGATHPGTQLGIHFFDCDQVINAAIARGNLVENHIQTTTAEELVQPPKEGNSSANNKSSEILQNVTPLDDSKLYGNLKLLTLESAQVAIDTVANFVREDDRFIASFFNPLWNRLRDQGAASGLNWTYEQYRNPLSMRNWYFVPPNSTLGVKGVRGKDYFSSEEQVALCVLKEVSTMKEMRSLLADHTESFSLLVPVLTRAVDEDMEYKDAKLGKSASVRTRRVKSTFQPGLDSSTKSGSKGKSPKKGQQILSKKGAPKITPESKVDSGLTKKQKTAEQHGDHTLPSFHMSQTQGAEIHPAYNRRSPGQKNGPLSGYSFFYSGIDPSLLIDEKIKRLGGKVVPHNSFTVQKAHRNAFFLADYTSWRKMKYIYAAALGAPMLHYQWLEELEKKFKKNGKAKVFDSELYIKYRLPIGLDLSRGFYPLQRASNARSWDPPGCTKGEGSTIFHGMTIALAIDQIQDTDWKMILKACGATVKTLSDVQKGKGKITVHCCLFASTSLPPHMVSKPAYVSKLMQFIGDEVPLLDLAWAHQSIIQRKRLPLDGDRYSVSLDHGMSNTCSVFSVKSKVGIRYEVGDLVQFSRSAKNTSRGRVVGKNTSRGRVVGITFERQGKRFKLETQLLDSNGDFGLVDCSSSAKIDVEESNLQGNILMLGGKDFRRLGYLPKNSGQSNIFDQLLPSESQM